MVEPQQSDDNDKLDDLARRATEMARAALPRVERLVADARPVVEQATQRTLDYVRDHEDELREAGLKLARVRLGALGLVVDAFSGQAPAKLACPSCQAPNPAQARFCNQCGGAINPPQ